ncbi:MAG: universal stress protein [Proteobacteria bacterium]|nr:universal stress protein [Pseudomonadota bacterium]
MHQIRKLLIAVKDARSATSQTLFDKAAAFAKRLDAEVCLFHALSGPLYVEAPALLRVSLEEKKTALLRQSLLGLERSAERMRRKWGVRVSAHVTWDFPVHEAVVRAAKEVSADLVVINCHRKDHAVPWLLKYADWELVRSCPLPLLLMKSRNRYARRPVLAAIDPSHSYGKPRSLDGEILAYAASMSGALRSQLHVVAAYDAFPGGLAARQLLTAHGLERAQRAAAGAAQRGAGRAARAIGVPRNRVHIMESLADAAIQSISVQLNAQMVVMGAVSRTGVRRFLIGNTAERVLDDVRADVLVVKPRNFSGMVPDHTRGARVAVMRP